MQLPDPLSRCFNIIFFKHFTNQDLLISWQDKFPELSLSRKQIEDHFWDSYLKQNPESSLFNGILCRLISYNFNNSPIKLTLGPIQFKTHFFSIKKGIKFAETLGENPKMGLGVSTTVVTSDDKILFMKRSDTVASNPGDFDVFGGHIDPESHRSQSGDITTPDPFMAITPDPFEAIRLELTEEINVKPDQIESLEGVGLIQNQLNKQFELIFSCFTKTDAETIIKDAEYASDRSEYSHIIRIPNDAEKLGKICIKYASEFSPSGLGSLWFHYLMQKPQPRSLKGSKGRSDAD